MKLNFDEIQNWEEFEDMVAEYFRQVKTDDNNISDIKVEPTGNGTDGGRDILVTFRVDDSVQSFKRKWVIQCKFLKGIVKEKQLATINIPGKIHQYNADGFLLVVKHRVQSNVSKMFEDLNEKCKFNYSYEIWNGNVLRNRVIVKNELIKQYFPSYFKYTNEKEEKLNKLL